MRSASLAPSVFHVMWSEQHAAVRLGATAPRRPRPAGADAAPLVRGYVLGRAPRPPPERQPHAKQGPPAGTLSTVSSPPAEDTMSREMDSPSPVPTPGGLVVKNDSKMRGRTSSGCPGRCLPPRSRRGLHRHSCAHRGGCAWGSQPPGRARIHDQVEKHCPSRAALARTPLVARRSLSTCAR